MINVEPGSIYLTSGKSNDIAVPVEPHDWYKSPERQKLGDVKAIFIDPKLMTNMDKIDEFDKSEYENEILEGDRDEETDEEYVLVNNQENDQENDQDDDEESLLFDEDELVLDVESLSDSDDLE